MNPMKLFQSKTSPAIPPDSFFLVYEHVCSMPNGAARFTVPLEESREKVKQITCEWCGKICHFRIELYRGKIYIYDISRGTGVNTDLC